MSLDGSMSEPLVGDDLSHADLLRRARLHADERGFDDVLIVDADFHHSEPRPWAEILEYVDNDVVRHFLTAGKKGQFWIPELADTGAIQAVGGRIRTDRSWKDSHPALDGTAADVALAREAMAAMGSDYILFFPGYLLNLGTVKYDLEAPLAIAWARWVADRVLSEDSRITTLLPLPLSDPAACVKLVEEFAGRRGVVGFMVTSLRYEPLYTRQYAPLWRAIEEAGLALGFHSSFTGREAPFRQLNRFLSIHAITFPLFHMIQCTNWVVNGMAERYPGLKPVFIEGGLAWVPFLMERLDHEYLMRKSEAPLLKRLPSEYMRDFYYTCQPMEATNLRALEFTFNMINAESQLLYASDWPHWDWDPPRKIWDLPFLDEEAKRNILGRNAQRLFGLSTPERTSNPGATAIV